MGFIQQQKDRIQGLLDKLTNDSHVPIAIFVFLVTSVYHFHTGKDLGTNYTNTIYALYGFLGGHAAIYQKWPDPTPAAPAPAPVVDVNVQNNDSNTATAAPADPTTGTGDAKG
jgi:hypothetical protein